MPPRAYEERFTAENDGIISQLGLDTVMEQAQETVANSGIIQTVTPTPVPKNLIEETEETEETEDEEDNIVDDNIFTQWDIFGGNEPFTQKQFEQFSANFLSPLDANFWKGEIITGSSSNNITFSSRYMVMARIVQTLTYGLFIFFWNTLIRDGTKSTPEAPYGYYVTYPTFPLVGPADKAIKSVGKTWVSPEDDQGSYNIYLKDGGYKKSLDTVLFHQKRKSLETENLFKIPSGNNTSTRELKETDTISPSLGFANLFAWIGSPILNEDIGTPEFMELQRRGKEMIPNSTFRFVLVLSSIIMITIWWMCADWIESNYLALKEEKPSSKQSITEWGDTAYNVLVNLEEQKGKVIIEIMYGSFFVIVIIGLIWCAYCYGWYKELWGKTNILVDISENKMNIQSHNNIISSKELEDKIVKHWRSSIEDYGEIYKALFKGNKSNNLNFFSSPQAHFDSNRAAQYALTTIIEETVDLRAKRGIDDVGDILKPLIERMLDYSKENNNSNISNEDIANKFKDSFNQNTPDGKININNVSSENISNYVVEFKPILIDKISSLIQPSGAGAGAGEV